MGASSQSPDRMAALLSDAGAGRREAMDAVLPIVYDQLHAIAARHLRHERIDHTLDPTALVHEAYLKLAAKSGFEWHGETHLMAVAARAMRQILVDHARRRNANKRGGDWARTTLDDPPAADGLSFGDLIALDDALHRLDEVDRRLREVVEYRFFGGLSDPEIAEVLGITARTVQRDWVKARAWLYKELYPV